MRPDRLQIGIICVGLVLGLLQTTTVFADTISIPRAPSLNAASWVLADANSGQVITTYQPDASLSPASMTKIMTSYVVADQIARGFASLDDDVRISAAAQSAKGSRMFIEQGRLVKVRDLIKGVVIQSGNDASIALAEYIAGSESGFVDLMNQHAADLGMDNTYFLNATGLPAEGHRSTATDLLKLTKRLIERFPEHYKIYSEKFFSYGLDRVSGQPIKQRNRNRMLWIDNSVDGVKTGYTEEAGYCLVVSAKRKNMRLISVLMGAPSKEIRVQGTQKLLTYGFRFFESLLVLDANNSIDPEPAIWGGLEDYLAVGVDEAAWVVVPKGEKDNLISEVQLQGDLWAPLSSGDEVGVLRVSLHGRIIMETPLLALEDMAKDGLFGRALDGIGFFLVGLWTNFQG